MKIENERDFKIAENIVNSFKKVNLTNFTGADAYLLIASLEWLVNGMSEFKKPPNPSVPNNNTTVTNITTAKPRKK